MTEVDRDAIVDHALELFSNQGYNATTLADIASASDVQPDIVAAAFPDKVSFIFAVVDALFGAVFEELAKIPPTEDLVDALRAAHQNAVERIIAGEGPVPLIRMHRMGRVIAINPAVTQAVSVHRKQVLTRGLADQRGLGHDDSQIKKAVTVWSAIMASTHAAATHDDDEPDRFATNLTIQRLNRTFNLVRGNASPDPADDLRPRPD
jgi:AcrR family transcriptional regulator